MDERDARSQTARVPATGRQVVKQIIIVGYPKSGCTWATRLVAELVGCPVAGFWGSTKKEIAVEGEERVSEYRCYKAHHQLSELGVSPEESETRVIYILRDPRDIAISAANYFQFERFPFLSAFFRALPQGNKLYRHTLYPLLVPENYRLAQMTEALLHGSAAVHNWVRVSWRDHWRPYQEAGVLIVRYEDLLAQPNEQSSRILASLGLKRTVAKIAQAVECQSFARKKEILLQEGETGRARFLRVGRSGQWQEKLPLELRARFSAALAPELAAWGYPVAASSQG